MAATPEKTATVRKKAPQPIEPDAEPVSTNGDGVSIEEEIREADEAMEILEPKIEAKRWIIGKPPEEGGKDTQFSVYTQQPLGFMARNRLYALIGRTMAEAIKTTGGSVGGMEDVFGASSSGTIIERTQRLGKRDLADASQFFTMAMELVSYVPDFLSEFYAIVLDVPYGERTWFKQLIEQPYRPYDDKWGLDEDAGIEMVEIFIDQNYEDIRRFFTERLPKIAQRASQREQQHKEKTLPTSA